MNETLVRIKTKIVVVKKKLRAINRHTTASFIQKKQQALKLNLSYKNQNP
jgi:hypothetical protein